MYINHLPPVLEEMLEHDQSNDIVHLEISDGDMLKDYFVEQIIQGLVNKIRMLVVVPDRMDISIPSKILTNNQLAHLCAIYPQGAHLDDISHKLRTLADLKPIHLLRQEYQHILLKYQELSHKIHDTLLSINKAGIKSPSFKEMLLSIKPRPAADIPTSVVEKISQVNLNPGIINGIKSLQGLFQKRFMYIDSCVHMADACIEDVDALKLAKVELSTIKARLNHVIIDLERELFLMKRVINYELEEELSSWLKIKEELQNALLENELDNRHSSFEDRCLPILKKLSGHKYLKLSMNVVPEMGWGQVSNILGVITAVMDSAKTSIDIYFEEYVRKLSLYNTSNEHIDACIREALAVIRSVNNCKYLDHHCKDKYLQVDALVSDLKSAHEHILLCTSALNDEPYMSFKIEARDLNIDPDLLRALYHLDDEDWSRLIEFYGQRSHLINNYNANMSQLENWSDELKATHHLIKHTVQKELHNRWCGIRNQAIASIKNNHWDIYKTLFESKEEGPSFVEFIEQVGQLALDFFPVIVINESNVKKAIKEDGLKFGQVFYLDPRDIDPSDVQLFRDQDMDVVIATTQTLDLSTIRADSTILSNYCSLRRSSNNPPLVQLDSAERYQQAVGLSSALLTSSDIVNVYKRGEKVFISTLSPLLEEYFLRGAKIEPQHILFKSTSEVADLVETLIHHDNLSLLIENNLLNDRKGISTLWQSDVLRQYENAGVTIHNVYTHQLYHDLQGTVARLVEPINEVSDRQEVVDELPLAVSPA